MKKLFSFLAIASFLASAVVADELKVNIGVESGVRATQVVGADVYTTIDGKLYEITIAPDDVAFKMNGKYGALRIKSFWLTNAKIQKMAE